MKKYLGFMSSIGFLLVTATSSWAASPQLVFENSSACPGKPGQPSQEEEFRIALQNHPDLLKLLSSSKEGVITVRITNPTINDSFDDMPMSEGDLRSSKYHGGNWNLDPYLNPDFTCSPIKSEVIAQSIRDWQNPEALLQGKKDKKLPKQARNERNVGDPKFGIYVPDTLVLEMRLNPTGYMMFP